MQIQNNDYLQRVMSTKHDFSHLIGIPSDLASIMKLVEIKKAEIVYRIVLIGTVQFTLIDVKLPRFSEDSLYENTTIRTLVPRGLCFIFANNVYCHTLYGHPKFGNFGDYTEGKREFAKRVFRRKENGECAHWGAFELDGIIYEIFGSKNVHMVVRSDNFIEDLKKYSEMRYLFALKMAHIINNYSKSAVKYLIDTKNTFCGEGCFTDSQHIVTYESSKMFFFAITGYRNIGDPIVKVNPIDADELFTSFGLPIVTETILADEDNLESIEKHFENQPNSEGAVVCCLDDDNNVMYVYKHKNYDYIFLRALREQMRKYASTSRILARFKNLHIVHPEFDKMIDFSFKFNAYFRVKLSDDERKDFFSQWVTHKSIFDKLSSDEQSKLLTQYENNEKKFGTLNVIIFVAIPGSGKSFVARVIKELLEIQGKNVVHLEQDMFFSTGKNAAKNYDNAVKKASDDLSVEYIILTKSNHTEAVREKTYNILNKCSRNIDRTYVVMNANDGDMDKTFEICLDRAVKRGNAHTSLYGKTYGELKVIIKNTFIAQYEPLTDEESFYNVVNLNIDQSKTDVVKSCVQQLCDFSIVTIEPELLERSLKSIYDKIDREDNDLAIIASKKAPPKKLKIGYDAIIFKDLNSVMDKFSEIKKTIDDLGLAKKEEFHVTLKYHGGVSIDVAGDFDDDQMFEVTIKGYAVDRDALALYVELPKSIQDIYHITEPHITYALGSKIKPSYCKTLIENSLKTYSIFPIEDTKIVGFTKRFMM